jgi:hypothetical protein
MVRFRLVQALSRGVTTIRPDSLYYAIDCFVRWVIGCLRCIADCYFYSQENRLIDMISFRLCYNLNKHTSDYDSILGLRPISWVVVVIGPPVRMNICGIVTSP